MNQGKQEIKYPVGVQSFTKLREEGFVYVDKTAYLYPMIKDGGYYFLSRPRRFGKSLLLSTLEAYFKGRRDLFKGLAIDTLTEEWDAYPVLHLDLNNGTYTNSDGLKELLVNHLNQWETEYGLLFDEQKEMSPGVRFSNVIKSASERTGRKVVILIDEYDKPLLNVIDRPELMEQYRVELKAFYSNLKTMDGYIRMAILTGVARFSKVSVFSDLNNLRDITFENEYSGICGITTEELEGYFREGIHKIARNEEISYAETIEELQRNYDGYHFSAKSADIYNPFSLINSFAKGEIGDYWHRTGTPNFLVSLVRRANVPFKDIAPIRISRNDLEDGGLLGPDMTPIFYQTGYLTIKGYDRRGRIYTLDYPNVEVKEGFLRFLASSYMPFMVVNKSFSIFHFIEDVRGGDAEGFMRRMETLIAGVPYSEKGSSESHFQNAVYLLFSLMGFYCKMEERTSSGRIDLRVETDKYIFIIEFKIDSTSAAAMSQIEEKQYWLSDRLSGKEIILIGANFDTKTRRLDAPLIRRMGNQNEVQHFAVKK